MPKRYISHYNSPNIIIKPTVMIPTPPSPKRAKIDSSQIKQSPKNVDISFLDDFNIDEIVSCLQKSDGMHNNFKNHNKVEETSITKKDVKLDNISNIKMCDKRCTTTDNDAAKPEDGNGLSFSKLIKEPDNQKKDKNNDPPVEKNMGNIETKVSTLKEDINSTLSFKFIEYPAAEIKSSDHGINNDLDNYIRIIVNVNLVPNDNLKTTRVKAKINDHLTRAENKEMHSSKNNKFPLNNKLHELHIKDSFKSELKSVVGSKKPAKNIVRNRDDILLATLEKYMLNILHMQCSVLKVIHYGEYSKIIRCKNTGGEEYAIKMLNLRSQKKNRGGVQKKIMLKQIQSDIPKENLFCIFLHNCFTVKKHWCFLMDFYPNNLRKVINDSSKPLNIHIVQDLARQLISAVMLLRNNNIVHSDIKPSHILLNCSNDKLKLCGFDKAYYIEQVCMTQCIGTLSYRPPEVILGYSAGFSIDVWSTGLVLHEMVTGRRLFPGYSNADVLYQQMSILGNMPPEMITLSRFCTQYFIGDNFTQTFGFLKKRTEIIYNFNKTNKLYRTINGAYFEHWAPSRTNNQRKYDIQKINLFVNLLQKIIVLHPKSRLTIEFVFANPFIYNMYY